MESTMSNLPDNCQDNNPTYPWNQEDSPSCPDTNCGAPLIIHCNDKYLTDIKCSECNYTQYIERFDTDDL
tara:strand:+ start:622 stop:831 length:210 start_codon:yes stop_codon:yes gene_type:complete